MGFLRRIGDFYRLQLRLIWRLASGPTRPHQAGHRRVPDQPRLARPHRLADAEPADHRLDWWGALAAVIFLAVLNLLVRPLILATVAGRSVIALGLLTLAFQVVAVLLLNPFVPGVSLGASVGSGGILDAVLVSFVFGLFMTALSAASRRRRGRVVLRRPGA